jgi:hypothetical protein
MSFDVESLQAEAERRRREYSKAQRELGQALRLRSEALTLGGMRQPIPNNGEDRDWSQEIIRTKMNAVKAKTVLDTLNGDKPPIKPRTDPGELALSRQRTIEALVKMGKSDDQIQAFLEKTSGYVDALALAASDPTTTALLFNKVVSGNGSSQQLGVKEVIEIIRMSQDLKSHSSQSDPAALMNAAGNLFRTGVETARNNTSDPVAVMKMLTDTQAQNHAQQLQMYERLLESQQPRTLAEQLEDMQHMQETLFKLGGADTPEIQMKKLELTEARDSRQFSAVQEEKKTKAQTEMFKTIAGGLTKALESPVLRQLGRNVGSKLGVENPIAKAQNAAAQEVVQNPTAVPWGFNCPKCHTSHSFTAIQLAKIKDSGGRWVDPVCGEVYSLQAPPGGDPSNDKDNVSPS